MPVTCGVFGNWKKDCGAAAALGLVGPSRGSRFLPATYFVVPLPTARFPSAPVRCATARAVAVGSRCGKLRFLSVTGERDDAGN
jgi:hypothetical protein